MKAKLYYEAHVTIEPVFNERRAQAAELASSQGFRLADLLMKKRQQDTEVRSKNDTFMTGHSKELSDITARLSRLVVSLQAEGFAVWRYKIEDTVMDSRSRDELGLLPSVVGES